MNSQKSVMKRSRLSGLFPGCRVSVGFCAGLSLVGSMMFMSSLSAAPDNSAPAATKSMYYYYYFDQVQPLPLNQMQIAVFKSPQGRQLGLDQQLASFGITKADINEQWHSPGWALIDTPAQARNLSGVQQLVNEISQAGVVDFVSPVFIDDLGGPRVILQDLIIGFQENMEPQQMRAVLAQIDAGEILEEHYGDMPGVYRLRSNATNGYEALAIANRIAQRDDVIFSEPDMICSVQYDLIPNDTYFSDLWGLHNTGQNGTCQSSSGVNDMDMDCPEAWDITTGDSSIIIVILDDGVQLDHFDLNVTHAADFSGMGTGGYPGNECDNHGTAVAGTCSAVINNSSGVVGNAPTCSGASAKYSISNIPCNTGGTYSVTGFVDALTWAGSIGARVSNLSATLGGSNSSITNKYQSTYDNGMVHFSSTGNDGISSIGYPANLSTVNAVGSISDSGNRSTFSNYGSNMAFVAPGEEIRTTDRTGPDGYGGGNFTCTEGTSFSSPYAAGVAALILSVNDGMTASDVEYTMNTTCMDRGATGFDNFYGWGIVNAHDAMVLAGSVPANDNCGNATQIFGGPQPFSTIGATGAGPSEPGECSDFDNDVWFKYLAEWDGPIEISVCDANFDTVLAVYEGDCPTEPGTALACNDNGCGQQSKLTFTAEAWYFYPIRIGGKNGEEGTGTLEIVQAGECPADLTGDDQVNIDDIFAVLGLWGDCPDPCPPYCEGDITEDCTVNIDDIFAILGEWGPC